MADGFPLLSPTHRAENVDGWGTEHLWGIRGFIPRGKGTRWKMERPDGRRFSFVASHPSSKRHKRRSMDGACAVRISRGYGLASRDNARFS